MNPKIEKLEKEIDKTKAKIAEMQGKLRKLEEQKTELENTDYVAVARSYKLTPQQPCGFLKIAKRLPLWGRRCRRNRRMGMRIKKLSLFLALMLAIGATVLPLTAYAAGGKDTTPPELTASLDGGTLKVESSDDNSGVEAVFVDGNRINSLTNGAAKVTLRTMPERRSR